MSIQEANKYVEKRFEFETELRSYMQDETETGVFNISDWNKFDDETKINVADDLKYQMKQEIGWLY